jgi:hypothetical protein
MFILGLPFLSLGRYLRRIFFSSILASTALVWGMAPEFSYHSPRISFSYTAYSQDISDQQVANYARAVLKIEDNRQQAYANIQRILGKKPPEIACHRRESLRNLPSEAQKIAVSYCNNSVAIVENSGLTRSQFNDITRRLRTDSSLKKRVQDALIRIQREQKK